MFVAVGFVLAALSSAQAPPSPTPGATDAHRALRIAVYDVQVSDVPGRAQAVFKESLLAELRKLHASVISLDEVKAMLAFEADKQTLGCNEGSCLSEIADALGADALIVGRVSRLGDESEVVLKRIDAKSASVTSTFNKRLVIENGEELLAVVGPAVEALFPDLPLLKGAKRGVDPSVALRVNPPPVPRWAFFTSAGAAASALVVTGGLGVAWIASQADYSGYARESLTHEIDGAALTDKAHSLEGVSTATWVGIGVTAATAALTAALAPLTDFTGAGDAP